MIRDGYSRDKSTPLADQHLGGRLDLIAAYGYEINGRTIVMFRRKIQSLFAFLTKIFRIAYLWTFKNQMIKVLFKIIKNLGFTYLK